MIQGWSGRPVTLEELQGATVDIAKNKGIAPDQVVAFDVINRLKELQPPVYTGDKVFYRLALVFLGIVTIIAVISLAYTGIATSKIPEGLVAISSAGIGALATLFATNK